MSLALGAVQASLPPQVWGKKPVRQCVPVRDKTCRQQSAIIVVVVVVVVCCLFFVVCCLLFVVVLFLVV